MISRAQQILLKRAQREAGLLNDAEYREALALVTGCRSTTDPRMTNRAVDLVLAYFEAIYWHAVDAGQLQPSCNSGAVFARRGFWAARNPSFNTSRDRYVRERPQLDTAPLEAELEQLGCGPGYCQAIRARVTTNLSGIAAEYAYQAALRRTIASRRRKRACTSS